jgi:hypothetical protein
MGVIVAKVKGFLANLQCIFAGTDCEHDKSYCQRLIDRGTA